MLIVGLTMLFKDTAGGGNTAAGGNLLFTASNSPAATRPSVLRDANKSRREKIGALTAGLQKVSESLNNNAPVAQVTASN